MELKFKFHSRRASLHFELISFLKDWQEKQEKSLDWELARDMKVVMQKIIEELD
jgi:hypothetical protein